MKRAFWLVLNISLLLLLLAFCMFVADTGRKLIGSVLSKKLVISPENDSVYSSWIKPPVGSVYNYYIWHVENAEGVEKNGEKPKMKQVGPFCYESRNEKVNVTHSDGSVKYKVKSVYVPMEYEHLNCLPVSTNVTTWNTPYAMVMEMLEKPSYRSYKGPFNFMIRPKDWTLFMTRSANEILWGYEEPAFAKLNRMMPTVMPIKDFGYAMGTNNSVSKFFEINDGSENIRQVGEVNAWMNMSSLSPIWRSDYSNQILGTDGNSMPPLLEPEKGIFIFVDQMCRSVYFQPEPEAVKLGDIETWRFVLTKESLKAGDEDPNNIGFCIGDKGSCSPSGTLDLTTCMNATTGLPMPFVLSKPHFLHGDESLLEKLDRLAPSDELHHTALYAEPMTGLILKAAKRLQINYRFSGSAMTEINQDSPIVSGGIFPLYVVEQTFEANDQILSYVYKDVISPLMLLQAAPLLVVMLGVLGSAAALIMGILIHSKEKAELNNAPVSDRLLTKA